MEHTLLTDLDWDWQGAIDTLKTWVNARRKQGLYGRLKSGSKVTYSAGDFSIKLLQETFSNLFYNATN